MAIKNQPASLHFFVQDTATGLGVASLTAGGSFTSIKLLSDNTLGSDIKGNITLTDGGAGYYSFSATAAMMNVDTIQVVAVPSTATYQAYSPVIYTEKGNLISVSGSIITTNSRLTANRANYLDKLNLGSYYIATSGQIVENQTAVLTAISQTSGVLQTEYDSTQSTLSTINGTVNTISSNLATVDGIVDNIKLKTDLLPDSTIDGKTHEEVLEILLAYVMGKVVKSGDSYIYKKQNGTTTLFTLTTSETQRTTS